MCAERIYPYRLTWNAVVNPSSTVRTSVSLPLRGRKPRRPGFHVRLPKPDGNGNVKSLYCRISTLKRPPPPVPSSKEIVYRRSSQPPRAPIPVHVFTGNGIVPEPVRIMTKSPGKSNTTISAWQHSRIIDYLRQGEIGVRASLLACGGGGYKRGWKGVGGHEVV